MLDVYEIITKNNASSSTNLVYSCDLWHGRLGRICELFLYKENG